MLYIFLIGGFRKFTCARNLVKDIPLDAQAEEWPPLPHRVWVLKMVKNCVFNVVKNIHSKHSKTIIFFLWLWQQSWWRPFSFKIISSRPHIAIISPWMWARTISLSTWILEGCLLISHRLVGKYGDCCYQSNLVGAIKLDH